MENPPPPSPTVCARCQKPATTRCTGCVDAPVYEEILSKNTFYCSAACQKEDWDSHKTTCKALKARKTLKRAASLLQEIFYAIREQANMLRYSVAKCTGSIVHLSGDQYGGGCPEQRLMPFSGITMTGDFDKDVYNGVLAYASCVEVMVYLCGFAKELLFGLCSKVEEVAVKVTNEKLIINSAILQQRTIDHNLHRVTLKNGEVWVVDITGAQYGYPDPLCVWSDYEHHRITKVTEVLEFGSFRYDLYPDHSSTFLKEWISQRVQRLELTEALEKQIPEWGRVYGGRLDGILKGSDEVFSQAKDEFLGLLDVFIKDTLAGMYTPERVAKRWLEVGRLFRR
ncbi:hypothetical protein ASPWEDRAFT_73356 [Aspergillus wentii DTO 134E9]|uniref:MYND-type domain-containing protein n=1 Tax=Aspergillus wentii DTO 134E9 TaxID=1073089 RepID=A0A1L9R515_ASPWE|nr:uncharacterized protein ASPWEDRAFT_73356 [Aspergillus wentii DTO 134E9]OJJ29988.1 hypothetical protein ASPWEDRAFT_73356 [Aspergillus wentii DTO 134E9]